ncbi:MAG: rhomboid family intramembrane serine protease [Candidatus Aenigmarchaeota archaeon]|nr:rhomboid family intramembrane serine protease [Candidatus Aenigmarchaeota archaeon]
MKGQFFPYHDENPRKRFPVVNTAIIIANIIVFIWSLTNFEAIIETFGFRPAELAMVTIFTSMFLHGGIDHIFGNMWFLFIYGDNVEDRFGKVKYLLFYLLAGVAATLTHYATNLGSDIPAIGASGAISGVLGAYIAMFPHVHVRVASMYGGFRVPAWALIGFWFLLQLLFGTISFFGDRGSGIAFWAHIGGFAFGFVATRAAMAVRGSL